MKVLKERSYVKEIEELFVPFFELHPTKDLNELFVMMKEQEKECNISTRKKTTLEDARLSESMDLYMCMRTNEIKGYYEIVQSYCYKFGEKKKEELRSYPIVLTEVGIRVREEVEITEEDLASLEQFKFLIELIDLSESSREGLVVNNADISERKAYTRVGKQFSYSLGYNADKDHDIITTVKKQFDIEKPNNEISFRGRCSTDGSDDGFSIASQNHSVELEFGNNGEEGSVQITGSVNFH